MCVKIARKNSLLKASGKIPAEDEKLFVQYVKSVVEQWGLTEPVDIMIANRMVSSWMKMRYVEGCISKYGMFFEDERDGKVYRIRMNELAYYLKQLEADFRSYYRLLNTKSGKNEPSKGDFFEMLDGNKKKEKKKSR